MRLRDPRLWLAIASAAILVVVMVAEFGRTAPGPLSASHDAVAELEGRSGCRHCHGLFGQSMAGACKRCHTEIDEQLRDGSGFHGSNSVVRASRCTVCHMEHQDGAAALVDEHTFRSAGSALDECFEHDFVAFALHGAHDAARCVDCHAHAEDASLAEGAQRFTGLDPSCTCCHDDPHGGRLARSCEDCHGQTGEFDELTGFVHSAEFLLIGSHAGLECESCHAPDSGYEIESVGARALRPQARVCANCHATPHSASFLEGVATVAKSRLGSTCATCHSVFAEAFAEAPTTMPLATHAASGFELSAGHAAVACDRCHVQIGVTDDYACAFPGGRTDDCATCHGDPHAGQFATGAPVLACVDCHTVTRFAPSEFNLALHADTALPLLGAHERTACDACHLQPDDGARTWRGAPVRCEECHLDAHDGRFDPFLADAAPADFAQRGTCSACHGVERFDELTVAFDHGRWTDFALDGAHADSECVACHGAADANSTPPRSFGFADVRFPGPSERCETCHEDAHRQKFGEENCSTCHSTQSFSEVAPEDFDHGRWTSFAIDGAHAEMECVACHGAPDAGTTPVRSFGFAEVRFPGPSERCATCHEDAHYQKFGEEDCSTCHSTRTFSPVAREDFDHGRWTNFALEGAHASTQCAACHVPVRDVAIDASVHTRATGRTCAECHADVHAGQFDVDGATDCARCHDAQPGFARNGFDHDRDSRFALDADHARLACDACHAHWPTADGKSVVRYRPLGLECIDCHGFEPERPAR